AEYDGKYTIGKVDDRIRFIESYDSGPGATVIFESNFGDELQTKVEAEYVEYNQDNRPSTRSRTASVRTATDAEGQRVSAAVFRDIKLENIRVFRFMARPKAYEWVEFKNVSLKPGHKTAVQVEGEDVAVHSPGNDEYEEVIRSVDTLIQEWYLACINNEPLRAGACWYDEKAFGKEDVFLEFRRALLAEQNTDGLDFNGITEAIITNDDSIIAASEGNRRLDESFGEKSAIIWILTKDGDSLLKIKEISLFPIRKWNFSLKPTYLKQNPDSNLWQKNMTAEGVIVIDERASSKAGSRSESDVVIQAADMGASAVQKVELSYDDGRSDGQRSIAGSGHGVIFDAPGDGYVLKTVRIFGSRYGHDTPPDEDFHIYVCDENLDVIEDLRFPYSRFTKGDPKWVTLRIDPVEVPSTFVICAGFNPERTKGVYVHFDTSSSGNSLTGLPGGEIQPFNEGEWMIRTTLEKAAQSETSIEPVTPVTAETKNLQELINSARAGDTVIIPAGTYNKPLYIDKSLTLKGKSQSASIIEVTADMPAIMIDTKGKGSVTIEDLTIKWQLATSDKHEHPYAIGVKDTKAKITKCAFYPLGNPQRSPVAVNALGFSNLTISGCQFEGFEYVISYREGTEGKVEACLIKNCGHQGVMSYAGSTLRVERNVITGSKYHAVRTTGGTIFVKDNLIISNANRGIYLGNKSGKGTISNNVIMKNGTGIDGFASSNFKIENNVISDNSYAGIGMRNTTSLSIRNNILTGNQRGLVLFEPDGTSKNKIDKNAYWKNEVDTENVTKAPDSLDTDPAFTDPENGDFSLKDGQVKEQKHGLTNPQILKQLWNKWKGIADSDETKAAPSITKPSLSNKDTAPIVVSTTPAAFSNDVSTNLQKITVTFDQPMMDRSWSWTGGGDTYPETPGQIRYDQDKTTCSLPVRLEPGKVYWVGINSPSYKNFKNPARVPAQR
ncbi:MAG: right-handed parallel beta-helix repeat-containing protein, partial [Planctomycetota bacterium]